MACGLAAGTAPFAAAQVAMPSPAKPPVVVEAQDIRARPDQDVVAEGDAQLRQGEVEIRADRLSYDHASDLAKGTGRVRVTRDGNIYSGTELQLQLQRFEGYFIEPTYFFSRTQAGGQASRIDFLGEDRANAADATYTSCPRDGTGDPAWLLSADNVQMNFAENEGIADGAVLRFYGVPILAAPKLSFPLTDARKSGWLPPSVGLDDKSGLKLSVPYYWNIAPNRDATLTPIIISKRGVGLGTEFRYLEPSYQGTLNLNLLSNDRLAGRSRGALRVEHEGSFLGNGFYQAQLGRVSDDNYWKDFPGEVPSLTPRLLGADLMARKDFGNWNTYARVLRWQVLQDLTQPVNEIEAPYDRLPQIGVRGAERIWGGLEVGLEAEVNHFTTADGNRDPSRTVGTRLHALGSISWQHVTPGWTLVPKLSVNAAHYALDRPLGSEPGSPPAAGKFAGRKEFGRAIPTFSIDSGWVFERDSTWFGRAMRQTLEPRLLYVKTPYHDQTGLPKFDTAGKDFNFDSIYTDNAFSGIDRVSDAHQVTAGIGTRFFDSQTGAEALRLGIAQRYLLADQRITPEDEVLTRRASDVLLLGSSTFWEKWKLDAGLQYSPDIKRTVRSIVGVRYSPGAYRTINTAYRLKRGESEQVELGWQWPLYGPARADARPTVADRCSGTWYSVGRLSYSLRDSRITDSILGLEYDSGCWIGRVVAKRLSTSQQEATTQLGFEIEFIGLSRLGTNALGVLKDNIPGYRMLREDVPAPLAPR